MKYYHTILWALGLLLFQGITLCADTHFADVNSLSPSYPYTDWSSAATNIQDAVDVAQNGDKVLVADGVYDSGKHVTPGYLLNNRVVATADILIESVNGPEYTFIVGEEATGTNGFNAVRCVYMEQGVLSGFTLTNGHTRTEGDRIYDRSGGGFLGHESNAATIINCVLIGNSSDYGGGGAAWCNVYNSHFTQNSSEHGGAHFEGDVYNSAVYLNTAVYGGGLADSQAYNCTITQNSAADRGGGIIWGSAYNSIIFDNTDAIGSPNYSSVSLEYSCSTPMPGSGIGNITNFPILLTTSTIASNSPCIWAGSTNYSYGASLTGGAWANPPAIGCDEPTFFRTLEVSIVAEYTGIALGYGLNFSASLIGVADAYAWDFGDGSPITTQTTASHVWGATGMYDVVLTVVNLDHPGGVSATTRVNVVNGDFYVNADSLSPSPPYDTWNTAARDIQLAVTEGI